jgi:hypothetical protein
MRKSATLTATGLIVIVALVAVAPVAAQAPAAAKPAPAAPAAPATPVSLPLSCDLPEHREFDFWIGDWDVSTPDGNQVGTNRITLILGTCVLLETWKGKSGLEGWSFNVFDRVEHKWHQTWVDSHGMRLDLVGTLVGKNMVLSGTRPGTDGGTIVDRITWEPIDANHVRQLWEQSKDGGKTWAVAFDGKYVRHAGGTGGGSGRNGR